MIRVTIPCPDCGLEMFFAFRGETPKGEIPSPEIDAMLESGKPVIAHKVPRCLSYDRMTANGKTFRPSPYATKVQKAFEAKRDAS
jgi:hypothetical protein